MVCIGPYSWKYHIHYTVVFSFEHSADTNVLRKIIQLHRKTLSGKVYIQSGDAILTINCHEQNANATLNAHSDLA